MRRTRILPRRTAGLLGVAGLSAVATVGFGTAAMADPSPGTSGDAPSETPATAANVTLSGASSVKSGGTATYTAVLNVQNGPLKDASVTLGGDWHGGKLSWSKGCVTVSETTGGLRCNLGDVKEKATAVAAFSAPKVGKDTSVTFTVSAHGTGTKELSVPGKSRSLLVKRTASPTPTKTSKPTPTKSSKPSPTKSSKPSPTKSSKPSPTKSHKRHPAPKSPSDKPSDRTPSTPSYDGNVPLPTTGPSTEPTGVPSIPTGTQSPWATPTDVPTLPSVAPSPEGSARNPNVAEPPKKATGLVRTDAVSVPAAAAAAFVGLGAGTLITRAVRRRGLWRPIGRHRE